MNSSIEQLISSANAGDMRAALELAEKYIEEGTLGSYTQALEWFKKVAATGDKYASLRVAGIYTALAPLYEDNGATDIALDMWNQGASYSAQGIPNANENMDYYDVAISMVEQSLYGAAAIYYLAGNNQLAIGRLELIGEHIPRANILMGICKTGVIQDHSEFYTIAKLFASAFDNSLPYATIEGVGAARAIEQNVFAVGACMFADMLISGNGVDPNPQKASSILELAYNAITDEKARDIIKARLKAGAN